MPGEQTHVKRFQFSNIESGVILKKYAYVLAKSEHSPADKAHAYNK